MRRFLLLLSCSAAILGAADLTGVHAVYLLPMARGMDQYLANRITSDHIFRVVTDPKMADAVLTDRIGAAFESEMADLYPPEKPPEKAPAKDGKDAKEAKKAEQSGPATMGDAANKLSDPSANSSFGRGKGMVFLVDVKSRQVVWSAYEAPKGLAMTDVDKSATAIVAHLKKDLGK
jgi:hypothetical protein